jgi:hypothetical protein
MSHLTDKIDNKTVLMDSNLPIQLADSLRKVAFTSKLKSAS